MGGKTAGVKEVGEWECIRDNRGEKEVTNLDPRSTWVMKGK